MNPDNMKLFHMKPKWLHEVICAISCKPTGTPTYKVQHFVYVCIG